MTSARVFCNIGNNRLFQSFKSCIFALELYHWVGTGFDQDFRTSEVPTSRGQLSCSNILAQRMQLGRRCDFQLVCPFSPHSSALPSPFPPLKSRLCSVLGILKPRQKNQQEQILQSNFTLNAPIFLSWKSQVFLRCPARFPFFFVTSPTFKDFANSESSLLQSGGKSMKKKAKDSDQIIWKVQTHLSPRRGFRLLLPFPL